MKSAVCAFLVSMTTAKRMGPFPTSCLEQEDGYQWLKLMTSGHIHNDYSLVYQKCDQEYMIIDPHEDPNVMEYVSGLCGPHESHVHSVTVYIIRWRLPIYH